MARIQITPPIIIQYKIQILILNMLAIFLLLVLQDLHEVLGVEAVPLTLRISLLINLSLPPRPRTTLF